MNGHQWLLCFVGMVVLALWWIWENGSVTGAWRAIRGRCNRCGGSIGSEYADCCNNCRHKR